VTRATAFLVAFAVAATAAAAPRKKQKRRTPKSDKSRYGKVEDATTTAAWRYGQMTQEECEAELVTRGIGFTRVDEARGVRAPVRLTGPLRGVEFNTSEKPEKRDVSNWMVADCRLALALDDFAGILAAHDIVEVRHYSMWRPPPKSWPEDKEASRHAGALALDAGWFKKSDGTKLDVLDDFYGRIGAKTCGDGAKPRKATPKSLELREILCETAEAHLFNVMLTPNYNRPHRNHFHLEVTSGVKWFLLH
jgi:hypothetical protein